MREVVYLSEGKLNEFLIEPRRALPAIKLHAGVPLAGIDVEKPTSNDVRELRRHLERIEKEMKRRTAVYTDPGLAPGLWVRFTTSLKWVTLSGRYQDLVLFVNPSPDSAHLHDASAARRLLLHGSARYLRGRSPTQLDGPELNGLEGTGQSAGTTFITNAGRVISALADTHNPDEPRGLVIEGRSLKLIARTHRAGIRDLLAALDADDTEVSTSAWMTGYARVSAVLPETATAAGCLVASPLIVEYVS